MFIDKNIFKNSNNFENYINLLKTIKRYSDKLEKFICFKCMETTIQDDGTIICTSHKLDNRNIHIDLINNNNNINTFEINIKYYYEYEDSLGVPKFDLILNFDILKYDSEDSLIKDILFEILLHNNDVHSTEVEIIEEIKEIYKNIEFFREMAKYYDEIKEA